MRLANLNGRAAVVVDGRVVDVEHATGGDLPSDPMTLVGDDSKELVGLDVPSDAPQLDPTQLGRPLPRPSKILAAALNYRSHAEESGLPIPDAPVLFAKLSSARNGPHGNIVIPAARDRVDWEAELVLAISKRGKDIPAGRRGPRRGGHVRPGHL